MLRAILSGEDRSPRRDVVLLNAAAALSTALPSRDSFAAALDEARASLDSGAALGKLETLARVSQGMAGGAA
jgi:anthranilate phosphoribosyltransferase